MVIDEGQDVDAAAAHGEVLTNKDKLEMLAVITKEKHEEKTISEINSPTWRKKVQGEIGQSLSQIPEQQRQSALKMLSLAGSSTRAREAFS